jgi:hypothetical protein
MKMCFGNHSLQYTNQTCVLFFFQLHITTYLQQYLAGPPENQTHKSLGRNIDTASH